MYARPAIRHSTNNLAIARVGTRVCVSVCKCLYASHIWMNTWQKHAYWMVMTSPNVCTDCLSKIFSNNRKIENSIICGEHLLASSAVKWHCHISIMAIECNRWMAWYGMAHTCTCTLCVRERTYICIPTIPIFWSNILISVWYWGQIKVKHLWRRHPL